MKKRILCYGDSNTWGYIPEGQPDGFHMRFSEEIRWTGVLQHLLGEDYAVIEEGMNSRTTSFDEEGFRCRNGLTFLESSLLTHEPMDVVVLFLGTNDLKPHICGVPEQIGESVASLVHFIQRQPVGPGGVPPKVLLVAPPHVGTGILFAPFHMDFDGENTILASRQLADVYEKVARRTGADYLDSALYTETGQDGLHLTAESHGRLAAAIEKKVRQMTAS